MKRNTLDETSARETAPARPVTIDCNLELEKHVLDRRPTSMKKRDKTLAQECVCGAVRNNAAGNTGATIIIVNTEAEAAPFAV